MSKIRVVFAVAGLVLLSTAPALLAQGVVSRDIDYVTGARYEDGKDLLDVFMPEGANGVPVVVFFHGGALRGGDKGSGVKSRVVCKSERKLLDASVRLPWRPPSVREA